MLDFYVPQYKWQLVGILEKLYPLDIHKFKKMKVKRLKAILISYRKRKGI